MTMWVRLKEPQQAIIVTLSAYEVAAIVTQKVPTISAHIKRLPGAGRVGVIAAVVGWMVPHFEVVKRGEHV